MRDMSMDSFSEGVLQQYETPLCEVFKVSIEKTILSNVPGKPGNYNSNNDITYEDEF